MASSHDTGEVSPVWNVPFRRNTYFTGRTDILADMRASLLMSESSNRVQAIHGVGGVGKTQLAVEFAYRHAGDYSVVWWIRSEEPTVMLAEFAALAEKLSLDLPEDATLEVTRDAVRDALDHRGSWLLIFDNVVSESSLRKFLPRKRTGHVLITSRASQWRGIARAVPLEGLSRDDAARLLMRRTGQKDQLSAARLAQALGALPLSLEHAAACITAAELTFSAYLTEYENTYATFLRARRNASEYPQSVAMTCELALSHLDRKSPAAADLLTLMSFLAADNIRMDLLRGAITAPMGGAASIVRDVAKLDAAVSTLRTYSLISGEAESLSVHRLVAALVRDRVDQDDRKDWAAASLRVMTPALIYNENDPSSWPQYAAMLPHVMSVTNHAAALNVEPQMVAAMLNTVGRFLHDRARYDAAREVLDRALGMARIAHGEGHANLAGIMNNLATTLTRLGETDLARELFEQAMAIDQVNRTVDDTKAAAVVNNYGVCLHSSGEFEAGRAQFEDALSVFDDAPEQHPAVANVVNNLGLSIKHTGDAARGRELFEKALALAESAYGPDHPRVARIAANLGSALRVLGDRHGARSQLERALLIDENAFGSYHPAVASDLVRLGDLLCDMGQFSEARKHYKRALEAYEGSFGLHHPKVARCLVRIGRTRKSEGDVDGAVRCFERGADIMRNYRKKKLGLSASQTEMSIAAVG